MLYKMPSYRSSKIFLTRVFLRLKFEKHVWTETSKVLSPEVAYNGTGIGMQQKLFFYNLHGRRRTYIALSR